MRHPPFVFGVTLCVALTLFAACGVTRGEPASAELALEGGGGRFTTATGWDVVLDEARLVIDGLHVFAPAGDASAALERVLWLGPSVALAHGGHDDFGGRATRIEWLGPALLDLLGEGPTPLGPMSGSVGATDGATLAFGPLPADLATASGPTHGHHAFLRGTASREVDGAPEVVRFEGGLDFTVGGTEHLIEAIAMTDRVEPEGRFTLSFELSRWLDQARFERLAAGDPALITPSAQVGIAWDLGLRDPMGIHLTYERGTP